MSKQVIIPKDSAPPIAPYSPGIKAGNAVYVSGIVALDGQGKIIGTGDVKAQTRAVLDAIKSILEAAGGKLSDITFNTIILKDFADYKAMNEVYAEYFPKEPPARYCIKASLVREEFLVEIASIAHL
jgi:aminoacrylate peracid reductase